MILFLDYDGVLHPDEAYLEKGRPVLHAEGKLFMWAPLLSHVLQEHPNVRIVLSTSWARELGYVRARRYLPEELRKRVIGATWHSGMAKDLGLRRRGDTTWWDMATRYQQIRRYVERAQIQKWVAIDDDVDGWGEVDREQLIQTDGRTGLSDPAVLEALRGRLGRNTTT